MLKIVIVFLLVRVNSESATDDSAVVFPAHSFDDDDGLALKEAPVDLTGFRSSSNTTNKPSPVNQARRRISAPPVPAGNLSTPLGDAACYSADGRFYCVSQFRTTYSEALKYCRDSKTKLLFIEDQDEQDKLYDLISNSPSSTNGFLKRPDFPSEEDYVDYVMENITPGLVVRCIAYCGHRLRSSNHYGRVMDFDSREFIGAIVKVQWILENNERIQRWYPAANLELIGYSLTQQKRILIPGDEQRVTVEPGHRVVILKQQSLPSQVLFPDLTKSSSLLQEIGIVQDVDASKKTAWAYFPAFNTKWQGPVTDLEVIDRRRAIDTYWTSGSYRNDRNWTWVSANQRSFQTYTNWAPGRPRHSKINSCVEIRYHKYGFWYNSRCSDENYFICKK